MEQLSTRRWTAADVMQKKVVVVARHDSLQEAMKRMTENHVTGLPVLDAKGQCVGVISASDILSYERDHPELTTPTNPEYARYFDPDTQRWESVPVTALEELAEVPVSEVMTRDLAFVHPQAPIREVAQKMLEREIHRVLVLDDDHFLEGIITAFDFVRLFSDSSRES